MDIYEWCYMVMAVVCFSVVVAVGIVAYSIIVRRRVTSGYADLKTGTCVFVIVVRDGDRAQSVMLSMESALADAETLASRKKRPTSMSARPSSPGGPYRAPAVEDVPLPKWAVRGIAREFKRHLPQLRAYAKKAA